MLVVSWDLQGYYLDIASAIATAAVDEPVILSPIFADKTSSRDLPDNLSIHLSTRQPRAMRLPLAHHLQEVFTINLDLSSICRYSTYRNDVFFIGLYDINVFIAIVLRKLLSRKSYLFFLSLDQSTEAKRHPLFIAAKYICLMCSYRIFALSHAALESLIFFYQFPLKRTVYLPYNADISHQSLRIYSSPKPSLQRETIASETVIRFLQCGNVIPLKNHLLSAEFLSALVQSKNLSVDYTIIGRQPASHAGREYLASIAERLPDSVRLNLIPEVKRDSLMHYYARSHFLLHPSLRDTYPKVVVEAALAGCIPIITDAVACAKEPWATPIPVIKQYSLSKSVIEILRLIELPSEYQALSKEIQNNILLYILGANSVTQRVISSFISSNRGSSWT